MKHANNAKLIKNQTALVKLVLVLAAATLWFSPPARAAFTFYATNSLPASQGNTYACYYTTNNPNVHDLLLLITNSSGGPLPPNLGPTWNFAAPQNSNNLIIQTEIVPTDYGTNSKYFTAAAYAEQQSLATADSTNIMAWTYYTLADTGRTEYGYAAFDPSSDGTAVFSPPSIDIPGAITNGQTWTLTNTWQSQLQQGFYVQFTNVVSAKVDALGTIILPNLGTLAAMRVHAINVCTATYDGDRILLVTNVCYTWLTPNYGVVMQIFQYGSNAVTNSAGATNNNALAVTNCVLQMFSENYYTIPTTPPSSFVPNLFLQRLGNQVALSWNITNAASFQVEAKNSLASTNWQILGLTTNTNWTDSISATQRYYRVVGTP